MTDAPAIPPGPDYRPVVIPLLGSINEPRLKSEGWRVVRDPQTGLALYLERIR